MVVAPGYTAEVLYAWGDPISNGPAFRADASNSWEEQAVQAGMHHDGLHYFPLPAGSVSSNQGLLAINHEYTDDGLLHPGGMQPWTAEKVRKAQAAHGVSVIEVRADGEPLGGGAAVVVRAAGHRATRRSASAGPRPATRCSRPRSTPPGGPSSAP